MKMFQFAAEQTDPKMQQGVEFGVRLAAALACASDLANHGFEEFGGESQTHELAVDMIVAVSDVMEAYCADCTAHGMVAEWPPFLEHLGVVLRDERLSDINDEVL